MVDFPLTSMLSPRWFHGRPWFFLGLPCCSRGFPCCSRGFPCGGFIGTHSPPWRSFTKWCLHVAFVNSHGVAMLISWTRPRCSHGLAHGAFTSFHGAAPRGFSILVVLLWTPIIPRWCFHGVPLSLSWAPIRLHGAFMNAHGSSRDSCSVFMEPHGALIDSNGPHDNCTGSHGAPVLLPCTTYVVLPCALTGSHRASMVLLWTHMMRSWTPLWPFNGMALLWNGASMVRSFTLIVLPSCFHGLSSRCHGHPRCFHGFRRCFHEAFMFPSGTFMDFHRASMVLWCFHVDITW